jgi:hypothetical protein
VAAQLARVCGNDFLVADLEEKAATAPASTIVAGWAAEIVVAGFLGVILSVERQSAMAAILARAP